MKIKVLFMIGALVLSTNLFSQKRKKGKDNSTNQSSTTQSAAPATGSFAKLKKCKKIDGLLNLYRDTVTGQLLLKLNKNQLNKEYIYFSYVENGNNTTGFNKGTFRGNHIIEFRKYYSQIEIIKKNNNFYFNPENEISKAANSNISNPTLASEKIIDFDETKGEYLIEADNIFLTEVLYQLKGNPNPFGFNVGGLSKSKTRYHQINNFPENTDIVVQYVYEDPYPKFGAGSDISDARVVEVLLQHSIIEMPDNEFKPRFDDPRIGYFSTYVNDMTTHNSVNYRDMIHRWRLVKKDPNAALSEPVKPIVWWIENTTPKELRPTIKEAILQWNIAFEKAGFKNAVQIFEQPDTATWSAGDIRYNVIRWTSSPDPPFGGYGPSFVNPRTGEILGADIMLEWVFITNRLRSKQNFENIGFEWMLENHTCENNYCALQDYMQHQNRIGSLSINALYEENKEIVVDQFLKEALFYLVLHEVGHTLGLNHNMKATQLHNLQNVYQYDLTKKVGLTGSVMDYPAVNFSSNAKLKHQFYTDKPGPYDIWAIEFGYFQENDEDSDKKRREKILMRSTEPDLTFGNDADDMRAPGKAIDPRVMIGDMSSDAVEYANQRILMIKKIQDTILTKYGNGNYSYHDLMINYGVLTGEWTVQCGVASRYIGGVYVDRSFANQNSKVSPYTAIPLETQKKAMKLLADHLFAPNAFQINSQLAQHLQPQRRGFNFFSNSEDPKLHTRVLNAQKSVLFHLLHPTTLNRIVDSKLYGNQYALADVLKDLTNAIFQQDLNSSVNTYRQNLQTEYVKMLIQIVESPMYSNVIKAAVHSQLKSINSLMTSSSVAATGDTKEHKNYVSHLLKSYFDNK